jgi:hypothetical protein
MPFPDLQWRKPILSSTALSSLVIGLVLLPDRTHADAAKDDAIFWALQPIERHAPPTPREIAWPKGDIDRFILKNLEEKKIAPVPDAERYNLLRRVTFDLTGLPPTEEEIEAFVGDASDQAYERVIDRLLQSTAFGDHWARHWFDVSCYADLADIQGNVLIRDAWRYRDYVIAAFNSDKPLDRFIHEQIAGDLLPYESAEQRSEQIVATGYLAIGPWTLQNYIKGQLAADVVDHQIDRIGRTFLGMTVACARCHDHKFDPIPTRDYYAMAGIFHSTLTTRYDGPGVWSKIVETALPQSPEQVALIEAEKKSIGEMTGRRETLQADLASLLSQLPGTSTANVLSLEQSIAVNEKDVTYEVTFDAGPTVWAGASQRTTASDGLLIEIIRADSSVMINHRHQPGAWSGKPDAQTLSGGTFHYPGDGTGDVRLRITSSTSGSSRFGGAIDNIAVSLGGDIVFKEDFDAYESSHPGTQTDTKLQVFAGGKVPGWKGAGVNHSHAVDLGSGNIALQFFGGESGVELAKIVPATDAEKRLHAQATKIDEALKSISAKINALKNKHSPPMALALRDIDSPSDTSIHKGGSFQSLGEEVPRGFLTAVNLKHDHQIPQNTSGRRELAAWLTDPSNPLTARVLVNRIWHHLYGEGLVRSVDYFGVHGDKPSHPELLDYLALQLLENDGWSLKKTVRRMVMSRTYQMATTHAQEAHAIDPGNRLRWRMPRRRLTAESIRDAMLAASGQLNRERGGPSLGLELPGNIGGLGGEVNPPTWSGKIPDYIVNRRSVYLPIKRERPGGELEILSIFDFPHPSEMVGARPETTVATQALFLMNSPFVKKQAAKLAERLFAEEDRDEQARTVRLYQLTVSRPPADEQIRESQLFLDGCEADFAHSPTPAANPRREAWIQLCHAMLASNDFLFRE